MKKVKSIIIDGVEYVPATQQRLADKTDGMEYVVCRTYSAGVHIGYLKSKDGQSVVLVNSRRLWYWSGANSLSQVATDGVDSNSKLAVTLPTITIEQVIEIIPVSAKAKKVIEELPEWKK